MDMMVGDQVRSQARSNYLLLRSRIIRGELAPLEKLKISALAAELKTNLSAVREALSRLTAEHLVEARDQQGFRVASISLEDLDDITANRIEIETRALVASINLGGAAWEERVRTTRRMLAAFEYEHQPVAGAAAHEAFHDALLAGCNSPTLLRIRRSLYELSERYRWLAVDYAGRRRGAGVEHDAIADAALARDANAASAALSAHIGKTAQIVRSALAQHQLVLPPTDAQSEVAATVGHDHTP